jgi:hypothetical protein
MRRRDHSAAGLFRSDNLRQPQAGDKRVEMDDVGVRIAQPAAELLGAASDHIALSL